MLSIIIPAYEIEPEVEQVEEVLGAYSHEIIVEYDRLGEGKGITLQRGFRRARGEFIAWLDADMELPPVLLLGMMETMDVTGADIVIGSKLINMRNVMYPFARLMLSWAGYLIIKLLFGLPIHDTQTGIKLFKRKVLERDWKIWGFGHDIEVLHQAHKDGRKIVEFPVYIPHKTKGSITWRSVFNTLREVLYLRTEL